MDETRRQIREMVEEFTNKIVNFTIKEGNRLAVLRMREARAKMKGIREGRIPFGEHPSFPKEKEALEFMLDMARNKKTIREISEALERQDYVTRFGKTEWNPGSVHRILRRHGLI